MYIVLGACLNENPEEELARIHCTGGSGCSAATVPTKIQKACNIIVTSDRIKRCVFLQAFVAGMQVRGTPTHAIYNINRTPLLLSLVVFPRLLTPRSM
jgi:hypothetical protein